TQIYWGAVPFVIIQLIMVTLVMTTPGLVVSERDKPNAADQKKALDQLNNIPSIDIPGLDLGGPPKF
ncbi:MAG TPA: C4-dicarboxylate ABC transporter, partial [Candidatus Aminicenantes bacterium]|nr:C4-dicarboxylate ABC transporter [Candidatus Aminicenantes bacterium]